MLSIEIASFGPPNVLRPTERPDPVIGPDELNILKLMKKRGTIYGSVLRSRTSAEKGAIAERLLQALYNTKFDRFWASQARNRLHPYR
jgi:hypothetical protein